MAIVSKETRSFLLDFLVNTEVEKRDVARLTAVMANWKVLAGKLTDLSELDLRKCYVLERSTKDRTQILERILTRWVKIVSHDLRRSAMAYLPPAAKVEKVQALTGNASPAPKPAAKPAAAKPKAKAAPKRKTSPRKRTTRSTAKKAA